jgi:hypothetical protein
VTTLAIPDGPGYGRGIHYIGDVDPGAVGAYETWWNSTTDTLYVRAANNAAWIAVGGTPGGVGVTAAEKAALDAAPTALAGANPAVSVADLLGAAGFEALTTPPVSATIYANATGKLLLCSLDVILSPTVAALAGVLVELSPDGIAFTTWTHPTMPIGSQLTSGAHYQVTFPVPIGWSYRVTLTLAAIGAAGLVAIG